MFWSIDDRDAATRMTLRTIFELGMSRNRSGPKSAKSLVSDLETGGNGDTRWNRPFAKHLVTRTAAHDTTPGKPGTLSHTIFEGTSEIQQLVIARAISGLRIE
jgi:alkylation response protein AidB-like acyl-CoA dehydrogenase